MAQRMPGDEGREVRVLPQAWSGSKRQSSPSLAALTKHVEPTRRRLPQEYAGNAILHDASHDSQLVLGLLPGGRAEQPLPQCDSLVNQPCRPNLVPVPPGEMNTNATLSVPVAE